MEEEVAVGQGQGCVVDVEGPHRLVADSGGQGVGVGAGGAVGPGAGHGVEGQVAGPDFLDAGVGGGVEVGCGGFDGGQESVVVVGEQDEVVSLFGAVLVDGGQLDRSVVVVHVSGDAVLLVLDAVGGFGEKVEGEFECVVHCCSPFLVVSGAPVSAGERSIG